MKAKDSSESPLFDDVPARVRNEALRFADVLDVEPGTELVAQHEYAREFFVIAEGRADVIQDGMTIASLGPGEYFGEIGLLGPSWRTASVVAATSMRLLVLAPREFRTLLHTAPLVGERIRATAAARA
jgi:CRP-like cAMP-binding protein